MKLDRNTEGHSKYALVRLRGIERGGEADLLLQRLEELGHIDFGRKGERDEFFVMKLCDIHTMPGLRGYAMSAITVDKEYGEEVYELAKRAGYNSPFAKVPD